MVGGTEGETAIFLFVSQLAKPSRFDSPPRHVLYLSF